MYIWARLGVSVLVNKEEAQRIFNGDTDLLMQKIRDGSFNPNGDSYVPYTAVEEFNVAYGTDYLEQDIDFVM